MRIVLASMGAEEFALLHASCERAGHLPVAYAYSRSMRPRSSADRHAVTAASAVLAAMPDNVDLLLPADAAGLGRAISGYRPDLLVIYGFNWILPASVFGVPRFGAINIHASLLPRYRGPAPVLWAIRNGDREIGVTVHRVDEGVDTGPILVQQGGIPLDDEITPTQLRSRLAPVLDELLTSALAKVMADEPGQPQPREGISHAGLIEPEYRKVDWSRTAQEVHNQVRVFRFMGSQNAPVARIGRECRRLIRTSLEPVEGLRVECADAPIWVLESAPISDPGPG